MKLQLTTGATAGLWSVGSVLPYHIPGGHSERTHRPRPEARFHPVWLGVAGRRRVNLQYLALVDSQRKQPTVREMP